MNLKRKIIISILAIIFVFTASFTFGYRRELANKLSYMYTNLASFIGYNKYKDKVQTVNAQREISSVDSSKDSTIIKKGTVVVFIDRKHKSANGKTTISDDEIKRTTAASEGLEGKKVKDVYKKYIGKGYKISAGSNEIVCVKIHTKGKYVAKLNGDNYEIYQANENGELELKESGGRVNHKGEDEMIFNKDPQEFDTLEEARESLSDFTS